MCSGTFYLFESKPDLIMKLNLNEFIGIPKIQSIILKAFLKSSKDRLFWEVLTDLYGLPISGNFVLKLKKKKLFNFLCSLCHIKFTKYIFSSNFIKPLILGTSPALFFYEDYILGYKPLFLHMIEDFLFLEFYGKNVNFSTGIDFFILLEFINEFLGRKKIFNILHNFLLCSSLGLKYVIIKKI